MAILDAKNPQNLHLVNFTQQVLVTTLAQLQWSSNTTYVQNLALTHYHMTILIWRLMVHRLYQHLPSGQRDLGSQQQIGTVLTHVVI